jgi:hypothetical protein
MKSLIVVGVMLLALAVSTGARDMSWIRRFECTHEEKEVPREPSMQSPLESRSQPSWHEQATCAQPPSRASG